ncbi:MAG: hypothetical protein ACSHX8_15455 [Opitutaceae bacterium]
MKSLITYALIFIVCLTSSAKEVFHTTYYQNSRALISFLKTEKKEEVVCVRVCVFDEAFRIANDTYAQSAIYDGKRWLLNSAQQIIYNPETGDPVRKVNIETKTLDVLPMTIEALYQKSDGFIIYLPGYHVFSPSIKPQRGISFVDYDSGGFSFLSSARYEVSRAGDQSECTLTLIDGMAVQSPFSESMTTLCFASLPIDLPSEVIQQLNLNQPKETTSLGGTLPLSHQK